MIRTLLNGQHVKDVQGGRSFSFSGRWGRWPICSICSNFGNFTNFTSTSAALAALVPSFVLIGWAIVAILTFSDISILSRRPFLGVELFSPYENPLTCALKWKLAKNLIFGYFPLMFPKLNLKGNGAYFSQNSYFPLMFHVPKLGGARP